MDTRAATTGLNCRLAAKNTISTAGKILTSAARAMKNPAYQGRPRRAK